MKKIFCGCMALLSLSVTAQSRFADSLKKLLASAKEDTNMVFMLTDIADEITDIDFKQSIDYAGRGLRLAEKLNFKKGIAQAYSTMANAYSDQSDYEHCLENNFKALEIRKKIGSEAEIALSLENIGNVYNDQGNFTKALAYYEKSRTIDEKNNNRRVLSQLYNNMGNAYANKGDLKQSVTFLFKALKLKDALGNKKGAANTANNIAVVYEMQGNYPEALNYNQKALQYRLGLGDSMGMGFSYNSLGLVYKNLKKESLAEESFLKALAIFSRLGYKAGIAATDNGLGSIYNEKKEYEKALSVYKEAFSIFEEEDNKMGMATALSNIASVYGKQKNKAQAGLFFQRAEKMAKEAGGFEVLMDMYHLYSGYYEDENDFKSALKYQQLYSAARDSLRGRENSSALADMKTKYETGIKEKENETLSIENKMKDLSISQKNTQRNVFIVLFIAAIAIAILLYGRAQLKKKEALGRQLLAQQEIRSKAVIEAEEKERVRIARELHDGIGQQLSAAKLNISALQASLKTGSDHDQLMLQNAVDLLDASVKEVRTVSHNMIPNALIKSGLVSAVREFINQVSSAGMLRINLEIVGLIDRLEHTKESVLFRILQEVVNNIIKHAKATEVSIQLIRHEKELTVLVEDNGVGFDVEKVLANDQGIGLKNIQSRVAFLNGQVFFDSQIAKGATITIEIPL